MGVQDVIALLIVAVSATFAFRWVRRSFGADGGCGCGKTSCAQRPKDSADGSAGSSTPVALTIDGKVKARDS